MTKCVNDEGKSTFTNTQCPNGYKEEFNASNSLL